MKISIGPYKNWFGPYQLAEVLCFWAKNEKDEYGFSRKPDWVHRFGEILAHGVRYQNENHDVLSTDDNSDETLLYKFLLWLDSKKKRRVKIKIDKYDTWNMDRTLAMIILPMLKQLKETKHGSPQVDLEDVPEDLRVTVLGEDNYHQIPLNFGVEESDLNLSYKMIHTRWDWVLNEMIWAFEQHQPDYDWESQYTKGEYDMRSQPCEWDADGKPKLWTFVGGPKHTAKTDWDARNAHQKRIDNGFRLFGKYYQGLWD